MLDVFHVKFYPRMIDALSIVFQLSGNLYQTDFAVKKIRIAQIGDEFHLFWSR